MKRRLISISLAFCTAVVLVCAVAMAQQQPSTRPAQVAKPIRPLAGNLHRDMEAMGDAFERLEKQISDASKNASSLEIVARMQQLTAGVKHLPPPGLQKLPEAERTAKLQAFRLQMLNLLRAELDVEEQLLAGDNEKAAQALKHMDEIEHQGHEQFQPKKEEKHEEGAPRRPGTSG